MEISGIQNTVEFLTHRGLQSVWKLMMIYKYSTMFSGVFYDSHTFEGHIQNLYFSKFYEKYISFNPIEGGAEMHPYLTLFLLVAPIITKHIFLFLFNG